MFLLRLQSDLEGLLLCDSDLAKVPVLVERKGITEDDIAQALGTISTRPGATEAGICCIVLMPTVRAPSGGNTMLQLETAITVRVIEMPLINQNPGGTGIPAEVVAVRILQSAHHWSLAQGRTLVPDAAPIEPASVPDGHIGYDVSLRWVDGLEKPQRVPRPTIALDPDTGLVSIACADADAVIRYTTDGTFPHPENESSLIYNEPVTYEGVVITHEDGIVTYSAPFDPDTSTEIRAIATRDGRTPSNLKSITLSEPVAEE